VPDRVPVGTHPGLSLALVGKDVPLAALTSERRATALFLRRGDANTASGLTVELRNATGGGGDAIALAFGVGEVSKVVVGEILGSDFYLRVTASDPDSENLSGWFQLESALVPGDATALTTLALVRQQLGKLPADTSDDTYLDTLILGASARIQRHIGRLIVESTITAETHSGGGRSQLVPRHWPVSLVSEVRVEGAAVASSTYRLEGSVLYRVAASDAYSLDVWPCGFGNVELDYTAGYAALPPDLVRAATIQAAYDYQKRGTRIAERGQVIDAGGSATYLTGPWAPGVLDMLSPWRDRVLG